MMVNNGRDARRVIALVFVATAINYVDRGMLGLLKPTLDEVFDWNDDDYGQLVAAFQFAAAFGILGAGWFVDRVGVRRGFAWGVGVWSLAAAAHALVSTIAGFVVVRVILGASEAVNTPAAVKAAAERVPVAYRSLAVGIVNTAPNIGAIITPLLIPPLAVAFGWRAAFIFAGALGFIWLAVWLTTRSVREPIPGASYVAPLRLGYLSLIRDRRVLTIAIAKVLTDSVWVFMLFFMPDLFKKVFGLTQAEVGWPVALAYTMAAAGALSGGWLPARLLQSGISLDRARKGSMLLYALLILPVPLVVAVESYWVAAFLLGLALFAHQGFSTNVFGMATDIFPSHSVATAIGIAAFFGNLAGIAVGLGAGRTLAEGYGYLPLLLACASAYLLALLVVQLMLPKLRLADAPLAA